MIEAKAPQTEIGPDEIEQAWTYANHPEVRAVYFALCNGRELYLFQTNRGPDVGSVLHLTYEELRQREKYQALKNLLSPEAVLRDHPEHEIDISPPLGPGLRSIARVTSGFIRYDHSSLNLPVLTELQNTIAEGAIERDEAGHLVAYLRAIGPTRSLQELNERLGLSAFEMTSDHGSLSTEPHEPTVFVYDNTIILPAGEKFRDPNTWQLIKLPCNISCHVVAKATGVLRERQFAGQFSSLMHYEGLISRDVVMSGTFAAHLA